MNLVIWTILSVVATFSVILKVRNNVVIPDFQ